MAIKSISQLESFDNQQSGGTSIEGNDSAAIGGKLRWLNSSLLTDDDKKGQKGDGQVQPSSISDTDTYYNSLIELSQPENNGNTVSYFSKKITYVGLIKNIIADVKAWLNYRNRIDDYNIHNIVDEDYTFNGTKTFNKNVVVRDTLNATRGIIPSLTANQITSNKIVVTKNNSNDSGKIETVDLSVSNDLYVQNVHIDKSLHINNNNVKQVEFDNTRDINFFYGGYAYGLADEYNENRLIKTHIPSQDNPATQIGDPVYFYNGRPVGLSCVNYARNAYNFVDGSGLSIDIGSSVLVGKNTSHTDWGGVSWEDFIPERTVVKFEKGKPVECNVIDFANHALWADLGEKYIADAEYEPGTLVKFGGEKEITIADDEVNAIVSTKAFSLNTCLKGGTCIALCGRVPTKVKGKIQKFDKIMLSDTPGIACIWDGKSRVIGRALESNENEDVKLVECVTKFEL